MSFTRRSALTAGAAALATGTTATVAAIAVAKAAVPDPIFAAIEAHRPADEAWCTAMKTHDDFV
jgi:hypothetical protein